MDRLITMLNVKDRESNAVNPKSISKARLHLSKVMFLIWWDCTSVVF